MAGAGGSSKRTWVVKMEMSLKEADKSELWKRHCIYRVPACMKIKSDAYQPQVVSLGPFHHGDPDLSPMEEHKRRALRHLLQRAGRPLDDFVAAVEDVAEELEGAYMDLGSDWRAADGRERFLEMMIFDGCFLLEVMRNTAVNQADDYANNDPIFSPHGILNMAPYIRRDVLMLENQIPLLLLQKLVWAECGKLQSDDFINRMMLKFLAQSSGTLPPGIGLCLHPLDVFRRSMLGGKHRKVRNYDNAFLVYSAVEFYEAGVELKPNKSMGLHDIRFRAGTLSTPTLFVDDSTEYMFLNMMAFERLHVGVSNGVTDYVSLMGSFISSANDVRLLGCKGLLQNALGSEQDVATLFNTISRDAVLDPDSAFHGMQQQMSGYYQQPWHTWRANFIHTYFPFPSPWAFKSFAAAVFLLGMNVMQTVYTVLQFYGNNGGNNPPPSAPSPM